MSSFSHKLPGEHVYEGVLFFGYSPPDILDRVKDFVPKDDDVILITYPKAGTTWLQEVVWLIMNNGDVDAAKKKQVYFRSPFLEFADEKNKEIGLDLVEQLEPPRVMKTHLPARLGPQNIWGRKTKLVALFRNPKDLCVSYFHFYQSSSSFGDFEGDWQEFYRMFLQGHVDHGSWFDFTTSWWKKRDETNLKIVFYEDMKYDLNASIRDLAEFLEKELSDDVIERITDHCSFESMKNNPMTNHLDVYSIDASVSPLLRKGAVGDWKSHFTVQQNEVFDLLYAKKMKGCEIPFKYEL